MHVVSKGFAQGKYTEQRKSLILLLDALLSVAQADSKGIKFDTDPEHS